MNKRTGKVVRLNRSLAVVLPKDWTRGQELQAGDEVEIVYNGCVKVEARRLERE